MINYPQFYNLAFIKEHPYPIVITNDKIILKTPEGNIEINENNEIIKNETNINIGLDTAQTRQESLLRNNYETVLMIGAGGLGFNIATTLAKTIKPKMLLVFDEDTLEPTNLERINIPKYYIGNFKTKALEVYLTEICEYTNMIPFPFHFNPDFMESLPRPDIVIEASDSLETQQEVFAYCQLKNINFIKIGSYMNRITITDNVPLTKKEGQTLWDTNIEQNTCATGAPQWQPTQILAAAQLVSLLVAGKPIECFLDIQELKKEKQDVR